MTKRNIYIHYLVYSFTISNITFKINDKHYTFRSPNCTVCIKLFVTREVGFLHVAFHFNLLGNINEHVISKYINNIVTCDIHSLWEDEIYVVLYLNCILGSIYNYQIYYRTIPAVNMSCAEHVVARLRNVKDQC